MTLALAGARLAAAAVAASLHVAVTAPGHAPKIRVHWNYAVTATLGGKPARAKLTEHILDPIGGSHPVEFGTSTKKIVNWPFTGTFRDFIIWPASSRGIPLRLQIAVTAGGVTKTITYAVTSRA